MAIRRTLSTPAEDDSMWVAVEAVSRRLGVPVSRIVAQALREYGPVASYLQAVEDMAQLAEIEPREAVAASG